MNGIVKAVAFQSATGQSLKMMTGTAFYSASSACSAMAGCMTFNVNFGYTFTSVPTVILTGATYSSWCNLMKLDVASTSTMGVVVAVTNTADTPLTPSGCMINWHAGGSIVLKTGNHKKDLGVVSEAGVLNGSDPAQKPAFEMTLGLIAEEDVSGIASSNLKRVKTIEVYRAEAADGDEVLVYKLFDRRKQIGGTIMISGMGTACLP